MAKMKKGPKILLILIILGVIGALAYRFIVPMVEEYQSDKKTAKDKEELYKESGRLTGEAEHVVKVAGDPWSGYSTFRNNPDFVKRLYKKGIECRYIDKEEYYDQSNRFRALRSGDIDIAVTTIDAYLVAGGPDYSGVIIFIIDESDGGDSIILGPRYKSFDDLPAGARVSYSEATPSEFLLDYAAIRFANLDLSTMELVPVVEAGEAYDKLKRGQVDMAVVWEPYTSSAEREIPGSTRIFDTGDRSDDVIIDIAVANRNFVVRNGQVLQDFVKAYFDTIKYYSLQKIKHANFIAKDAGKAQDMDVGRKILEGIDFVDLEENLFLWFGQGDIPAKIPKQIEKTAELLVIRSKMDRGDVPRPAASIINDRFLVALKGELEDEKKAIAQFDKTISPELDKPEEKTYEFEEIAPEEVDRQTRRIGELEVMKIRFRAGSAEVDPTAQDILDVFAETMREFPSLYCSVDGYTSSEGDLRMNKNLSKMRAFAIVNYLANEHGFPKQRFFARGHGPTNLIYKSNGEEDRIRSRRTEFVLREKKM